MVSVTIPRVAAAGAVIAAVLLVQLARVPSNESSPALFDVSPPPAREEPAALVVAEPAASQTEALATAKQRELEAMSETFRNTTFLIAIRNAGFACNELMRVIGGFDGSSKWLSTCSEMLSYTIAVANDGTLRVAPMLQYMDHGSQTPIQEFGGGELVLPQQLPQQSVPPPR
jgi:hypothetical protein